MPTSKILQGRKAAVAPVDVNIYLPFTWVPRCEGCEYPPAIHLGALSFKLLGLADNFCPAYY